MALCSIGELSILLGVAVVTRRRWYAAGTLVPVCQTLGGHRQYDLAAVRSTVGLDIKEDKLTIAYARVSSRDQAEQLLTQAERLRQHCEAQQYPNFEVGNDLGSELIF